MSGDALIGLVRRALLRAARGESASHNSAGLIALDPDGGEISQKPDRIDSAHFLNSIELLIGCKDLIDAIAQHHRQVN